MKRVRLFSSVFLFTIAVALLSYFLLQKYQLGLVRYFDMDELAYLNWTSHMVQGSVPYRDFLYQLPPGFLLLLSPVFLFSHDPMSPLTGGRILAFVIQMALIIVTGCLFYRMRKRWTAVFASLFLAFLPLPSDKLMELRPDISGTLFAMLGTLFQALWMEEEHEDKRTVHMVISGLCYGLSVFMLQKTIPHVAVAAIIACVWVIWTRRQHTIKPIMPFVLGGMVPFVPFAVWAAIQGIGPRVWYFITAFPTQAAQMAKDFYIPPWYFFSYVDVYFGKSGWNWGYIANNILWLVGILVCVVRFVTPYIPRGKKYVLTELLVSGVFLVQLIMYIYYMPFKHTQYLIPLAVFVAFYCADAVDIGAQHMEHSVWSFGIGIPIFCILFFVLLQGYHDVNDVKLNWDNTYEKQSLRYMLDRIPRDSYVFDLVGLSLYYPQPYYVSCLPVGQFSGYISYPLPSVRQTLEKTQTQYIYQGGARRLNTLLPEDVQYINDHYTPMGDGTVLQRTR